MFIEYWPERVAADSFTITLLAGVLLQILLNWKEDRSSQRWTVPLGLLKNENERGELW